MTTIPVLNALVVEDQDSVLAEWEDAITAHNADAENKGFLIEVVTSKSVTGAKRLLELHRFDAAVIDLRLEVEKGATENNSHGNELVRHIIAAQPLGVVVYTGQQGEAERNSYDCPQVEVMDKADGLHQVFEWLAKNKDVFLRLRGAKSAFNRQTAKVFFRSIWPRWKHWTANGSTSGDALTEVVARHVVAHVHDSMLHAGGGATHPEESYFVPPLKDRLDTGDLVDYEDAVWVIVTPRCDLANPGKVATVLLAACEDISTKWDGLITSDTGKAKEQAKRLIQHDGRPSQHFLHPMRAEATRQRGPWMVQFHDLKAVPVAQAIQDLTPKRFASLSPMFVPSLVERFGASFSRIGAPDFSTT